MHTNKEMVRGLTGKLSSSSWKIRVSAYVKLYSNASSIGTNRRNGRSGQLQGYHLTAIMQTWWDSACDWNAAMDGYGLLGRACTQGRRWEKWGAAALDMGEQQERLEERRRGGSPVC